MSAHYHLIGIGGIGMGALASLLLAKGHKVSGSDLKANDLIGQLKKNGAVVHIGHHASNVQHPDYVVHSSAVRMNNPEMIEAHSRKIPVLQRAQVLAQLMNEQIGIAVAGAHGKTTTTSMVASLLVNAGLKPTTAVGGIINGAVSNANLGEGKYFVAEVDESDGTFLYFHPMYSIITNIDFEHVDFYKNWDGILEAYRKFILCGRQGGCVIACGEDQRLRALVEASGVKVLTYGFTGACDIFARDIVTDGFHTTFACHTNNGKWGDFTLMVPGRHNVLNALACIALGQQLGLSQEVMVQTLKEFNGVQRRFQLKGQVDGIMVVDDYGHHPTEITATLEAARLFHPRRLVTIFQPHRYSRTKFLLDEMVASLKQSDVLVLTDIYAAGEKPTDGISTQQLFEKLQGALGDKVIFLKKEDIVPYMTQHATSGDLVLFLGAGDIYHLSNVLAEALRKKTAVPVGKNV